MKRVVLLGGGALHRALVRHWSREPLRLAECAWVVPAPQAVLEAAPAAVLAGLVPAAAMRLPLAPSAQAADVRLVIGRACGLTVGVPGLALADGRRAEFDLLSVDLQAASDLADPPGAAEAGHAGAAKARQAPQGALPVEASMACLELIERLRERAAQTAPRLLVAGRGLAGCELALAAAAALGRANGHVAWACGPDGALHDSPPALRQRLLARLRAERVAVLPDDLARVAPDRASLERGARASADLVLQAMAGADPGWATGPAIWKVPVRADRAGLAPWWHAQIGRFLGGGSSLSPPPLPLPTHAVVTGRGRALWAGHGLMWEGQLAGWWYRRRLIRASRAG